MPSLVAMFSFSGFKRIIPIGLFTSRACQQSSWKESIRKHGKNVSSPLQAARSPFSKRMTSFVREVVKWECKWRWMSVLHVYIPVSLGTTAFDRLCMADARAAWFSELDLSVKMKVIET